MSSSRVFHTSVREELARAQIQLRDLSQRLEALASRFPVDPSEGLELHFEDHYFEGVPSARYFQFRIVEDGPIEPPSDLILFASGKLPSYIDYPEDRIAKAWSNAHWAWAALATHTNYRKAEAVIGEKPNFFLCLRGKGLHSQVYTTSLREAHAAFEELDGTEIIEEFKFFAELQVFCAGIPVAVPPCLKLQRKQ